MNVKNNRMFIVPAIILILFTMLLAPVSAKPIVHTQKKIAHAIIYGITIDTDNVHMTFTLTESMDLLTQTKSTTLKYYIGPMGSPYQIGPITLDLEADEFSSFWFSGEDQNNLLFAWVETQITVPSVGDVPIRVDWDLSTFPVSEDTLYDKGENTIQITTGWFRDSASGPGDGAILLIDESLAPPFGSDIYYGAGELGKYSEKIISLTSGSVKGQLPGTISLIDIYFNQGGEITISSKDIISIRHGWNTIDHGPWSTLTPDQQGEFLRTADFDLFIKKDGEPEYEVLNLEPLFWYNNKEDTMTYAEYITFLPFTFEPGEYEFRGVWNLERDGIPVPPPIDPPWPPGVPPTLIITVIVE